MLHYTPDQQAAFDRWVDITAQLLQKYGPVFLAAQEEKQKKDSQRIISTTNEIHNPLESFSNAA